MGIPPAAKIREKDTIHLQSCWVTDVQTVQTHPYVDCGSQFLEFLWGCDKDRDIMGICMDIVKMWEIIGV